MQMQMKKEVKKFLWIFVLLLNIAGASRIVADVVNVPGDVASFFSPTFAGQAGFADGTAAAPSITFTNQMALGFHRQAGSQVYFSNNAANAMLGIGPFASTNSVTINGGSATAVTYGSGVSVGWSGGNEQNAHDLDMARGGTSGALRLFSGTAPTCTGNCGTSPSVAGNNTLMNVTIGTAPPAAANFTVTFAGTWTNAPKCIGGRATTGTTPVVTGVVTTTTTAVVNLSANLVAGEVYTLWCPSS